MTPSLNTLNIPIRDALSQCQNLLIAGMGGGFDLFCGLPLFFDLEEKRREQGQTTHLANLSFSQTGFIKDAERLSDSLIGIHSHSRSLVPYFPELHLAHWFKETREQDITIWCFTTQGAKSLLAAYRQLVEHREIDGILLVDGGVDSLMRGDETEMGTVLEDACSLAAVSELEGLRFRGIACIGLGAEQEVSHGQLFENIAALAEQEALLGTCSLLKQMECYKAYESAVTYTHAKRGQDPSVINASIVSAVQGSYGDFHLTEKTRGSRLWISPLMPIYWFFDLQSVADRNLFLPTLRRSSSFPEALQAIADCRNMVPPRAPSRIRLAS
jgi:hypothetical protein